VLLARDQMAIEGGQLMGRWVRPVRVEHFLSLAIPVLLLAVPLTSTARQNEDRETRCSIEVVVLTVTVIDANGHPVTNLTRDDFFVTDRKKPQEIAFFSDEDVPRSVAIVFSTSAANTGAAWLSSIRRSILRFKEQGHEMNEYFIIAARGSPRLVTDWTRDSDALMDGLTRAASTDAESGNAIYDACDLAREKVDQRDRPIILLLSDGQDMASQLTYSELRESFKRSNALVYSICQVDQGTSHTGSAQKDVKKLSTVSGGASYVVSSANEVAGVIERIATELRHQYLIGYYPVEVQRDGRWHRVRVTSYSQTDGLLDTGPLVVRSISGYNAPKESVSSQQD
jgi:Ca-activated chloride channel family protein